MFLFAFFTLDAREYSADNYTIDVQILDKGILNISENIEFYFVKGKFKTYIRNLPNNYLDSIKVAGILLDGQRITAKDDPKLLKIKFNSEIKIDLSHIATNSRHTIAINYIIYGAIKQTEDADILKWDFLPTNHDYTIKNCNISLHYPDKTHYLRSFESKGSHGKIATTNEGLNINLKDIPKNGSFLLELNFTQGSLVNAPPLWQIIYNEKHRFSFAMVIFSLLILIAGLVLISFLAYKNANTWKKVLQQHSISEPPDSLFTPEVLFLFHPKNIKLLFLSFIYDLHDKNIIILKNKINKNPKKTDYLLQFNLSQYKPENHEKSFLKLFYEHSKDNQILISEFYLIFWKHWKLCYKDVLESMIKAKLIDSKKNTVFHWVMTFASFLAVVSLVSLVLFSLDLNNYTVWSYSISFSLALISSLLFLFSYSLNIYTYKGIQAKVNWSHYSNYLKKMTCSSLKDFTNMAKKRELTITSSLGLMEKSTGIFKCIPSSIQFGDFTKLDIEWELKSKEK